ncbi:MAG: DUF2779 domain-containing protein [Candidatus Undinarchaeales archaeon]|nr:DUF2779 domain-containing protein [Candidatus Undinarchaeales archaeon]
MTLLTKSRYIAGLQCPRFLWTKVHEKETLPEPDITAQAQFDTGDEVGELAKKVYPDGVDISFDSFTKNLKETTELLAIGDSPLFEPGVKFGNFFSRADILVPVGDGSWDIVEVKSGTKVKEINLHDVSFQKYCYTGAGLRINKCYLMHINNEYIRNGELDVKKLFAKDDITEQVDKLLPDVPEKAKELLDVMNAFKYPKAIIGKQCRSPYKCPIEECWNFLPDNNVFHLYRGGQNTLKLFENGIHAISDIPPEFALSEKQDIQKRCEKDGKPYIDKPEIKKFLDSLEYPLYYLDFETFRTAVPMFDNTKPYQQLPFQFSLHIQQESGEVEHKSFLYNGKGDPRREFADALKNAIGESGTIVAYNESFEKARINELAELFPEFKKWNESVQKRFVDLIIPFRNFYYYNPLQKGSASLKKTMPALTGKGYDGLDIADGETASVKFLNVTYRGADEEKKKKVREDLEKYCGLDTEGMIWIVNKLKELV